ncbi:hypothetical protein ACH4L5_37020 [Streptomyces sp. NPDC017405]|uniref:hypothetical protein n=1 Tax=unclassified Streptomyces TaxID=2593676 RepID=UPI003799517A
MWLVAAEGVDDTDFLSSSGVVPSVFGLARVLNDYHKPHLRRTATGPDGNPVVLQAPVSVIAVDLVTESRIEDRTLLDVVPVSEVPPAEFRVPEPGDDVTLVRIG